MRRIVVVLVAVLLVASAVIQARVPGAAASAPSKKVCKTVKKKGKKQKVCHTVKPKPTATPRPTPTSTPLPPGDMAQKLANDLTAAGTDDARAAVLLNVFKAIHIGVYSGTTGTPIAGGMETNGNDVYVYDAELTPLAGAIGRKEVYSFGDLARLFTSLGLGPVDGPTLASVVQALTKSAVQSPGDPSALVPLLVRDLGEKHATPYDLATVAHPETVQLDPLQLDLLAIAILAPLQHAAAQPKTAAFRTNARAHYGACTAIKVALNPFNPNTYLPDSAQIDNKIDAIFGSVVPPAVAVFMKSLDSFSAKWGDRIGMAGVIASALHGLLLSYGLTIESGPTGGLSTHYGPAGHAADAGKPLSFQARVMMVASLPEWLSGCLHDAGFDVPAQGPVPGVEISWDDGGFLGTGIGSTNIEDYGTVAYNPADRKTSNGTTSAKGVAEAIFTPKNEAVPGLGKVVTEAGEETPRALWGIAFTNPLGTISELLFPLEGQTLDWNVTHHKANGYKFRLDLVSDTMSPAPSTGPPVGDCTGDPNCDGRPLSYKVEKIITGRICGANPYGKWAIHMHTITTIDTSLKGLITSTNDGDYSWYLPGVGPYNWGTTPSPTGLTYGAGSPPPISYSGSEGGGYWSTTNVGGSTTLEEDTSCPETK